MPQKNDECLKLKQPDRKNINAHLPLTNN